MSEHNEWSGYNQQWMHLWLKTMSHAMNSQWTMDTEHARPPESPFELDDEDKVAMNVMMNHYTDAVQRYVEFSLDQCSIMAEWSERMTHMMQKGMGLKTSHI